MSFSILQKLRGALPHETARMAHRFLNPSRHAEFETLHKTPASDSLPMSFLPLHDTQSIFVHVPKAAGTSIGRNLFGCRTGDHMTLLDYRTAFRKDPFEAAFKFTFVRNPWDRLVSAFFYLQDGKRGIFDQDQAARSVLLHETLEDFVENFIPQGTLNSFIHFKEQHLFLRLPGQGIGVDFIGRYEQLHADFDVIAKRLGKTVVLEHHNPSDLRKSDYRELYTPKMIDIVARAYARDIEYFNYSFDDGLNR